MRVEFFKSRNVTWTPWIKLQRARWHSCMQWGWSDIRCGNHLEEFSDYWVFHICYKKRGVCWYFYPKKRYEHFYRVKRNHNEV